MSTDDDYDDDDRQEDPQEVVGDEGGAEPLGSPSRVDRDGRPPREQAVSEEQTPPQPGSRRRSSS